MMEENILNFKIFPKLSEPFEKKQLESLVNDYLIKLNLYLKDYIWQHDSFKLKVVEERENLPAHLEGDCCYGDNVEDEWYIVFMLLELSKSTLDIVIQLTDSDGEFLLIEAADYLPKWLNPETSDNRVYLHKGEIHIIPLPSKSAGRNSIPNIAPSLKEAVAFVRKNFSKTRASKTIQDAIHRRISEYPQKAKLLQHRYLCYLPAGVATILNHRPQLISPVVRAFVTRDPIDLKVCRAMKFFPPETRVMSQVTFTRCLYAQLAQQKFEPDRRVGWNLPPANSPHFNSHSLGMKLACGMEILASGAKKDCSDPQTFFEDERWYQFLKSLKDKGYFKDEIEGSKLYQKLYQEAQDFYSSSIDLSDEKALATDGDQIFFLFKSLDVDLDGLKEKEKHLPPSDDDSWLNLTPDQLDSILENYSGIAQNGKESSIATAITGSLSSFVNHKSGLDGVEFPETKNNKKTASSNVNFEVENFTEAVRSILDFKIPDSDGNSSSSMSGYSDDEKEHEEEEEMGPAPLRPPRKKDLSSRETAEEMKAYMEQMDRELADTNVGLSFERSKSSENIDHSNKVDDDEEDDSIDNIDQETDDFKPVDIDLTVLKNMLESFGSQQGLPGPASNLLKSMGIALPENAD